MPKSDVIKQEVYELKTWPGWWELPTLDVDCLALVTYAHFANAPVRIEESLPWNTCNGELPEIETDEVLHSGFDQAVKFFSDEGYDANKHLTSKQSADQLAFLSYLRQHLRPALMYLLWGDSENYTEVTRPAYSNICGFPRYFWYPGQLRDKGIKFITQGRRASCNSLMSSGDNSLIVVEEEKKQILMKAKSCMNTIEEHLNGDNKHFFFGSQPSQIDAVIYGYLAVLKNAPFKSMELKNHLHCCEKLKNYCERINSMLTKSKTIIKPVQSSTKVELTSQQKKIKKDTVITIGVGVSMMLLYAIACGVFTSRRSLLAVKLGTVASKK